MPYLFRPPTESEGPIGAHRLFQFYEQDRGVTVYRIGDEFFEVRYPSQDTLDAADEFWLGGMEHVVDDRQAEMLTDAGYGDRLTPIV